MVSPKPNTPCYGCDNRHIGCQCECSYYKDWKIQHEKQKAAMKEAENTRYGYHEAYFMTYAPQGVRERVRKKNKLRGQY